jgi:flagellar hook-associated protein 3 FlgL
MAVYPITTSRVSHTLQSQALMRQVQANSLRLFLLEQKLATGRRLLTTADDPVATNRTVELGQVLGRQDQILTNARAADGFLSAADGAIVDVSDLITQAVSIASEHVNSFSDADQRAAAATLVDGIISQLQFIGNRQYQGRYLFGGRRTDVSPLDASQGNVTWRGDDGDLLARLSSGVSFGTDTTGIYNLTVDQLFELQSNRIVAAADLNPAVTTATRLSDLGGALSRGVRLGTIRVTEHAGPDISFDVDLSGADTVGDVIARFNAVASTAGSTLTLAAVGNHLRITSGGATFDVADLTNGLTAADLGLRVVGGGPSFDGLDLNPRLLSTTRLADLNDGAGLALTSGVIVTNGAKTVTVSFAGATTVQDVLNRLNTADIGIRASINAAGTGIDVVNLISGSDLRIGENGGGDATALGIRSLHGGTLLSSLKGGRGVTTVAGDDLTITDGDGNSFGVDLDGAVTIDDVISRINAAAVAAGSTLTAGLAITGNGIRLSQPAGATPIGVQRANLSAAIDDLGLSGIAGTATELIGNDPNPNRAGGVFTALYELRDALLANDTGRISRAGEKLTGLQRHVAGVQGQVGARSAALKRSIEVAEDVMTATREMLSQIQDLDFAEAITKFQQAQTTLQANLHVGARLFNPSLLDFLR